MSQCARILAHLKTGQSIDPLTAISTYGIYRLGARIHDLRKDGHPIAREIVEVHNRFGETCRIARYSMARGQPNPRP